METASFTSYANNQYQRSQVLTASRENLLVMAYDGILRFLCLAERAMDQKHLEQQHENICKAQRIILELLHSLDPSANEQLATALARLYRYFNDRLIIANVNDDKNALLEVTRHITELREAWVQAQERCAMGELSVR
jgi:flagellar secretion chaperone FliS